MKKAWICSIVLALCTSAYAEINGEIPCPFGWSVQPNPSADNSLSYLNSDENLAVNVTTIEPLSGQKVSPASYARVSAQQMLCNLPVKSNLIADAWSFTCEQYDIESIVYGSGSELVLLTISGRNPDTEPQLEEFVRFLADQAKNN